MHGAHHVIPLGQGRAVGHTGNAEVGNLNVSIGMDKDVLGLDVSVNNAVFMGMLQGGQNANGNLRRHNGIQPSFFLNELLQGFALHILHHQVTVVAVHAHIQQVDDIVVGHFAGGFRLPLKTSHKLCVLIKFRPQHFNGHIVAGTHVNGTVNNGHAANADLLHQLVTVC